VTDIEQVVDGGAQDTSGILLGDAVVSSRPGINTYAIQVRLGDATRGERGPKVRISPDGVLGSKKLLENDRWLPLDTHPGGHFAFGQVDNGFIGTALARCLIQEGEKNLTRNLIAGAIGECDLWGGLMQARHYEANML